MSSTKLETETPESIHSPRTPLATPVASAGETYQLKQILAPVDFSTPSEAALRHALMVAERFGAKISLLHVITPNRYSEDQAEWSGDLNNLPKAARRRLSMMAERLISPSAIGTVQVRPGSPLQEISAAAYETGCDLITIASHGYTGLKHILIGSVAERIVRDAPFPVLVVRRPLEKDNIPTVIRRFDKILVPIDFSSSSLYALAYAFWFARRFGAKVTVLHVVEPPGLAAWLHAHSPELEGNLQDEAESKLNGLQIDPADAKSLTKQLRTGVPLKEILNTASSGHFDLLVLAGERRIATGGNLLGSTAERLLRHASCPVLITRERKNSPPDRTSTAD